MSQFQLYLTLGWKHMSDLNGYDHMLFLLAMVAGLSFKEWKKVTWLITAFTVGHTLALVLAMFEVIQINSTFIEYAILVSILLLALFKFFSPKKDSLNKQRGVKQYVLVLVFGLIHGFGFSNYLKAIIQEQDLFTALFGFNLGLELAQIVFVCLALTLLTILNKFFNSYTITKTLGACIAAWTIFLLITF